MIFESTSHLRFLFFGATANGLPDSTEVNPICEAILQTLSVIPLGIFGKGEGGNWEPWEAGGVIRSWKGGPLGALGRGQGKIGSSMKREGETSHRVIVTELYFIM